MKPLFLSLLLFIPLSVIAQPDQIPARIINNDNQEQFGKYFNSDSVRLYSIGPAFGSIGIFIQYEKTDTLNFNNPFFANIDSPFNSNGDISREYILDGVAYYQKIGNIFKLSFINNNAFPVNGDANSWNYTVSLSNDTLTLWYIWGPPHHQWEDLYFYVYRPQVKRWQKIAATSSGSNDLGETEGIYAEYRPTAKIFLDNDNINENTFNGKYVARSIDLIYTSGKYSDLLMKLKKMPPQNYDLLNKIFTADAAWILTINDDEKNNITSKNVVAANNVGYFLEQTNVLDAAELILDSVIAKFPEHQVAYLNLADVYRKQKKIEKALNNYDTYIILMDSKNMEEKIPTRVLTFVEENEKKH